MEARNAAVDESVGHGETAESGQYAPYIVELREFFASRKMGFGTPEDLAVFAQALREPGTFREELASLTRSVVYRERGTIALTELLEVMMVAMGGGKIADAGELVREPVRELLAFLGSASRRRRVEVEAPAAGTANVTADVIKIDEGYPAAVAEGRVTGFGSGNDEADGAERDTRAVLPKGTRSHGMTEFYLRAQSISPVAGESESAAVDARADADLTEKLNSDPLAGTKRTTAVPRMSNATGDAKSKKMPVRWSRVFAVCAIAGLVVAAMLFLQPWARNDGTTKGRSGGVAAPSSAGLTANNTAGKGAAITGTARTGTARAGTATTGTSATSTAGIRTAGTGAASGYVDSRAGIAAGSLSGSRSAENGQPQDGKPQADTDGVRGVGDVRLDAQPVQPEVNAGTVSAADTVTEATRTAPGGTVAEREAVPTRISPSSRTPIKRMGGYTVSSGVMAANLISAPAPEYPKLAKALHIEGQVILQAVVSRNGKVVATHVLRGHRLLRGAASDAVRRWQYRPYVVNGRPTDVATIVTVNFRRR